MRTLEVFCLGFLLLPACLQAGPMYGSVTQSGRGVPNVHIKVVCPGGAEETDTIGDGSFRITVGPDGRCSFTLPAYRGASATVFSYAKPTHYNFELLPRPGGRYELQVK
ncbi:MAG: hypothetical protein ABI833_19635 [Acidobacteriota bacterium]